MGSEPSMTLLGTSTNVLSLRGSHHSGQNLPQLCSPEKASERGRLLVGCYRKGEAEDADIYLTALVAVLCNYAEPIVMRVTDPRTGLPGRSQWLPTIFEVRHACELEMKPIRDAEIRALREFHSARVLADTGAAREGRMSLAELQKKYPDLIGPDVTLGGVDPIAVRARPQTQWKGASHLQEPLTVSDELRAINEARNAPAETNGANILED